MNVKLLRKVAKHILAEPKRLFMGDWLKRQNKNDHLPNEHAGFADCGTAACISGWAALLSVPARERGALEYQNAANSEELLGITVSQGYRLFLKSNWPEQFQHYNDDGTKKSAKIAAARIEHFIKTGGKE